MPHDNSDVRTLVGNRIKAAREAQNWSQKRLADAVGFNSLQIVSSIENGQREVKAWELFNIAKALHKSVDELLNPDVQMPPAVAWREHSENADAEIQARFLERCRRFRMLEEWCGIQAPQELKDISLHAHPSYEEVQGWAENLRERMELGARPACSLAKVLEDSYGVKIFQEDLSNDVAGCSIRGEFGYGVLLNSRQTPWRRNFSLAHELFHLLQPSNLSVPRDRLEQLAEVFASALLLPAERVTQEVNARIKDGSIEYEDLVEVAREFTVSSEALLWRLCNLKRLSADDVQRVRRDPEFRAIDRATFGVWRATNALPDRYLRFCLLAYRKGKIGLAKLAEYMEQDALDVLRSIGDMSVESKPRAETQVCIN